MSPIAPFRVERSLFLSHFYVWVVVRLLVDLCVQAELHPNYQVYAFDGSDSDLSGFARPILEITTGMLQFCDRSPNPVRRLNTDSHRSPDVNLTATSTSTEGFSIDVIN